MTKGGSARQPARRLARLFVTGLKVRESPPEAEAHVMSTVSRQESAEGPVHGHFSPAPASSPWALGRGPPVTSEERSLPRGEVLKAFSPEVHFCDKMTIKLRKARILS